MKNVLLCNVKCSCQESSSNNFWEITTDLIKEIKETLTKQAQI